VRRHKQLALRITAVAAMGLLAGTSAFAESRHSDRTRGRGDERATIQRRAVSSSQQSGRGHVSSNAVRPQRSERVQRQSARVQRESARVQRDSARVQRESARVQRDSARVQRDSARIQREAARVQTRAGSQVEVRGDRGVIRRDTSSRNVGSQSYDRRSSGSRGSYDRGRDRNGTWRGDSRQSRPSYGNSRYRTQPRVQHRPYYSRGRIDRVLRYGSGYRIWVAGAPYPFFVPLSHWRHDRFRVGLTIGIGGWYNPLGYYEYYDGYDGSSAGWLRGTVESVDYRRDTFVVRNDATGSYVTVVERDRGMDVRPGDYVELSGDWTRGGIFRAWDVDLLDYDRARY
jgi:hypothetical protein